MQEREIFWAVLEIADIHAQSQFLDRACEGNHALRERLRELIAAHVQSGEFLNRPAVDQIEVSEPEITVNHRVARMDAASGEMSNSSEMPTTEGHGLKVDDDGALSFLQPSINPASLGRLGDYEILNLIGRGGFGIVFKAIDERLNRIVAVKVMTPELAATSPARKRFLREARAFAAIRHPNVVHIFSVYEQPIPHLAMEYIYGETIQQRIDERGPLEVMEVVAIGQQIASGLAAAHATGLIHRDIKPSNILLENYEDRAKAGVNDEIRKAPEAGIQSNESASTVSIPRVKITDFGLARATDDASVTQSGVVAGTPMYMSPEQALGLRIDYRADLFSLGSVLYVMVCGRPPFRAPSTLAVLKRVAEEEPRAIREVLPTVPEWMCNIISKLHAKEPDDRFESAEKVAVLLGNCLAQLQEGEIPSIPKFTLSDRLRSPLIPRIVWTTLAMVFTVASLMFGSTLIDWNSKAAVSKSVLQNPIIETPPTMTDVAVELGPLVDGSAMGDGRLSDVNYSQGLLTLDATSKSPQIWINLRSIDGDEMTIQSQLRVLTPERQGFAKFVFSEGPTLEAFGQIGNRNGGFEAAVKTYVNGRLGEDKSVSISPLHDSEWITLTFIVGHDQYSLYLDDKLATQLARDKLSPGLVAIACQNWICELKNLHAIVHKYSQHVPPP